MSDAWAEWQRDHAAALAALQEAQRAYHRVAVNSPPSREALRRGLAEARADDGKRAEAGLQSTVGSRQSAVDGQQSAVVSREGALEALEAARVRLDEVRERMPR